LQRTSWSKMFPQHGKWMVVMIPWSGLEQILRFIVPYLPSLTSALSSKKLSTCGRRSNRMHNANP
jgi:hypothetical protein